MALIEIATPFNIDIDFEIAEFHKRLLAYFIDMLILFSYFLSMMYLCFGGLSLGENSMGLIFLVVLLPMLFYCFITELLFNGQTLGKKIVKIKVVSLDGAEPTLGQYSLRAFFRFYEWASMMYVIFFGIFQSNDGAVVLGFMLLLLGGLGSVIIIGVNKKSQRLGDIVAGTTVINTHSKLTVDDTVFMHIQQDYKVTFPEVMRLSDRDINTIKTVLTQAKKNNNYDMCNRAAIKVQNILKVPSDMYANEFLEKLLEDYNYLATRE